MYVKCSDILQCSQFNAVVVVCVYKVLFDVKPALTYVCNVSRPIRVHGCLGETCIMQNIIIQLKESNCHLFEDNITWLCTTEGHLTNSSRLNQMYLLKNGKCIYCFKSLFFTFCKCICVLCTYEALFPTHTKYNLNVLFKLGFK